MTSVNGILDGAFDERAGPSDLQTDLNDAEGIGAVLERPMGRVPDPLTGSEMLQDRRIAAGTGSSRLQPESSRSICSRSALSAIGRACPSPASTCVASLVSIRRSPCEIV